jgi:hypothetical protein
MRHDFSSPLEMVQTIHTNHDGRQVALAWPDIIPAAHRDTLHRRTGLHDRLAQYAAAAGKLSVSERQQVLTCLVQQNRIADLVTCSTDYESLSDLPKAIQAPVAELFGFAFELLTGLGVRDRHYRAIYTAVPYHVCPFCCCEYFDASGAPREDLDHYLSKSFYPFATVNLRNLVPMGIKCNERYKLAQDILRDAAGVSGGRSTRMQIGISKSYWTTRSRLAARTAKHQIGRLISTLIPQSAQPGTTSFTFGSGSNAMCLILPSGSGCVTSRRGSRSEWGSPTQEMPRSWTQCAPTLKTWRLRASQRANSSEHQFSRCCTDTVKPVISGFSR